jgi:hypothetical protein
MTSKEVDRTEQTAVLSENNVAVPVYHVLPGDIAEHGSTLRSGTPAETAGTCAGHDHPEQEALFGVRYCGIAGQELQRLRGECRPQPHR